MAWLGLTAKHRDVVRDQGKRSWRGEGRGKRTRQGLELREKVMASDVNVKFMIVIQFDSDSVCRASVFPTCKMTALCKEQIIDFGS